MNLENSIESTRSATTPGIGDDADITPAETADGLRLLRQHGLPHVRDLLARVHGVDRGLVLVHCIDRLLQQAETLCTAEVVFELYSDGKRLQCRVNGQHVPFDGVGLALAWFAFAGIQCRHAPLHPGWVFPGKHWRASTKQALDRAVDGAGRISPKLARAIKSLGIEGGLLVQKNNPQVRVRCTLDEELSEQFRAVA